MPDIDSLEKELGPGPMRFAPKGERSFAEQLESLSPEEKKCFDDLKEKWNKHIEENKTAGKTPDHSYSDKMLLRFARCSPGRKKFVESASWKVMKKFDPRYLTLTAEGLEKQLMTKTLFPAPGLKTKEGHDIFYMYPARYFPKQTTTEEIIDNLGYCMNTMCEMEKASAEGIGFMAYMNDWKMSNFSVDYCYQFMMMLQGRVPVRVRMFLIVNPPSWFGMIWKIMKPMLAPDFRKKVHVIKESKIGEHLMEGYETYLPDEMATGKADTAAMVEDFVAYRKAVEVEFVKELKAKEEAAKAEAEKALEWKESSGVWGIRFGLVRECLASIEICSLGMSDRLLHA